MSDNAATFKRHNLSIRTRMSPKNLFKAVKSLNKAQRKAVNGIGFGSLIGMQVTGIPAKLGHYVVDSFDPNNMIIKLKDGCINVNKQAIHDMLCVPIGGKDINALDSCPVDNPLLVEWRRQFEVKDIRAASVMRMIDTSKEAGIMFKLNFLMLFANTMSSTRKMGTCNTSVLRKIIQVGDFASLDWCGLIFDSMKSSKEGWLRNDPGCYYTGPLTVLTLLYLDATTCDKVHVSRQRPAIKSWTTELMKRRELAEIEDGGFGNGTVNPTIHQVINIDDGSVNDTPDSLTSSCMILRDI